MKSIHEQAGKHYCRKALKLDPQSENVHGNLWKLEEELHDSSPAERLK